MYLSTNRRGFWLLLAAPAYLFSPCANAQKAADKTADSKDNQVYEPGGDVKPPKLTHYVEPEFSPSSNEAYVEGTVKISTVVTTDGRATECRVSSGLSAEEDQTALDALKQWTFEPGTKENKPVKVRITVEIDFHLL